MKKNKTHEHKEKMIKQLFEIFKKKLIRFIEKDKEERSKLIKEKLRNFYREPIRLIFSCFLAVVIWGVITTREYPDISKYINDITIDYEASLIGTPADEEGYRIYASDIDTVDIRVAANRTKIGFLTKDSFYAKIIPDNYTGEQPVSVNIQLFKSDGNNIDCDYQLTDVKKAKVYFYKEITKNIEISNINAPNITAADGYKIKNINCDSVSITGPEPLINMIEGCTLNIPHKVSYDSRKSLSIDTNFKNLTFIDNEGHDINHLIEPYSAKEQFFINKEELSVMINISKIKNLDITYSLVDAPDYFNKDFILKRLTLSTPTLSVSSDDPSLDEMDTLPVSSEQNISLNQIGKDFSTIFDLNQALESYPKLSNNTNIPTCYVTFDNKGIEEKTFDGVLNTNSHFNIKNPYQSKYSVEIITQRLDNVTIVGPAADIAKLTADDLIVEIDISKSSVSDTGKINPGVNTYKAFIHPPTEYKNVWVYGNYTVDVDITELSGVTDTPTTSSSLYSGAETNSR